MAGPENLVSAGGVSINLRSVSSRIGQGAQEGRRLLHLRTPSLRKPGSIWPSQQGIGVSKDVWMLGIGLDLLSGDRTRTASA